jgi:hypothetical protein
MREYRNAKVETAESFWFDLTTTFRPENVARLPKRELQLSRDLIKRRSLKNRKGRGFPIKVAVIEVITASSLPVPETLFTLQPAQNKNAIDGNGAGETGRRKNGGFRDSQNTRDDVTRERVASRERSTSTVAVTMALTTVMRKYRNLINSALRLIGRNKRRSVGGSGNGTRNEQRRPVVRRASVVTRN